MSASVLTVLQLLLLLALTAGTFVFVAAEFALTTLERSTVDAHVAAVGDRRARGLQRAHRTLSFQLSGAQLGITLTALTTGFVVEPALAGLIRPGLLAVGVGASLVAPLATVIALSIATGLSMVFGELVAKNLAIAMPLRTARAVVGVHAGFSRLFRGPIQAMNAAADAILRRLGVEPVAELRSARSAPELVSMVRSSAEHGTLDAVVARTLARSLHFGDRTAAELMTPRVQLWALPADATVEDLIRLAHRTGYSRFPVYRGDLDDLVGVVHVKQALAAYAAADGADAGAVGALAVEAPSVPTTSRGDTVLERLRDGLQLVVVVDEYGGTAGIVTFEDVVEEIVGDVWDEHDRAELPPVRPAGPDAWVVSGLLRADELAEATGVRLPDDADYETLAGFVLRELGRIPAEGDTVHAGGHVLVVARMDGRRIAWLRVTRAAFAVAGVGGGGR